MTAICSLFNPLKPTGEDGLLAFYNDDHMNLGFTTQDPQDNGGVDVNAAKPKPPKPTKVAAFQQVLSKAGASRYQPASGTRDEDEELSLDPPIVGEPTGLIRNPSTMTAFIFQNLVRVYGITDADSTISLLSPGLLQSQFQTESNFGSLAGCSDGDSAGWLYYLSSNPLNIMEFDLAANNSTVLSSLTNTNILNFTTLAAFWDPTLKLRVLVYQSNTNPLILYFPDQSQSSQATGTDVSAPNTPIAACCSPSKSKYYLYFLINSTTDFRIRKIFWDQADGWSGVSILKSPPPAAQYTNFFVTPGVGVNHLFYIIGSGELYHFRDIVH